MKTPTPAGYCQCGCGKKTTVSRGITRRYVYKHWNLQPRQPDRHVIVDGFKCVYINLTDDKWTLVDEADYATVSQWYWTAYKSPTSKNKWYAVRNLTNNKKQKLHHLLCPITDGFEVDHKNGDSLDNRRRNLRPATRQQNLQNSGKRSNRTSRFKGVSRHHTGKWMAEIVFDGERTGLGLFKDEEDAARAYDAAAKSLFGEFARFNFTTENV